VIHVHGKDARVDRGALASKGFFAAGKWGRECLPGEGDTDWAAISGILEGCGYGGSLDLEPPAEAKGEARGDRAALESRLSASLSLLRDLRQPSARNPA
jgi:sugar phosphate isomerase/epimerase